MLILDQAEVTAALSMRRCIDAMRAALVSLARGQVVMPLRQIVVLPDRSGALAAMPAVDLDRGAMGLKVLAVMRHGAPDLDSHQGAVVLFDARTGALAALLDATAVTAIRTAAVSAVATELLARPDARDLAILGAGTQAATHLEAMLAVRPIARVRVWSRTRAHAERFAAAAGRRFDRPVEVAASAEEAVRGADVVCTTTASPTPIVQRAWLRSGAHVNAVGSSVRTARELDTATVAAGALFVDRRESALAEAGDLLTPMAEGAVTADHIRAELGEVLVGERPGRTSPDEITIFKSLGLGIEDVVAAAAAVEEARARGLGRELRLGGAVQRELTLGADGAA